MKISKALTILAYTGFPPAIQRKNLGRIIRYIKITCKDLEK